MITIDSKIDLIDITLNLDFFGLGLRQEALLKVLMQEAGKLNGDLDLISVLLSILNDHMLSPNQMDSLSGIVDGNKSKDFIARFNTAPKQEQ